MHREVEWLNPADDYILEFASRAGRQSPKCISLNIPYGRKHVGNRARELVRYGLLSRYEKGVYVITDRGDAYLRDELSAEDLNALEPIDDYEDDEE